MASLSRMISHSASVFNSFIQESFRLRPVRVAGQRARRFPPETGVLCVSMIYACDICKFIFQRISEVDSCPDCGKQTVRAADAEERNEFEDRQDMHRTLLDRRVRALRSALELIDTELEGSDCANT